MTKKENNQTNLNENTYLSKNQNKESLELNKIDETPFQNQNNVKNFKYLDNLIHSGIKEINLDYDIILDDNEDSEYLEGITLDIDNIIIDGNGFTVDARGKTRIFKSIGNNITIKNIILKNGNAIEHGGAILNKTGKLTIVKSTLNRNKAGLAGGAIHNTGELNISESELNENNVGAIYNRNGHLTINNSTLNKNIANDGGAIANSNGNLEITNSKINENTAKSDGGGITNRKGKLTINNSTLNGNTAKENGGAIYNSGELDISESELHENTAKENSGAIENFGGNLNICNSTIMYNKSDIGVIYNWEGKLIITQSIINKNKINPSSGAITNNENKVTIKNSKINENEGKAIYNIIGITEIFDCEISNNNSLNEIISNKDYLEIYNTAFKHNKSRYIIINDTDKSNLSIFYGEFIDNNEQESLVLNSGKFCNIEKTIFENNFSDKNIINQSYLSLVSPKIEDSGKTILNEGYILIKKSSPDFESKIFGEGKFEIAESIILNEKSFDFGYLDKKIHETTAKKIILDGDICLKNYERDFYEGGIELDIDGLVIDGDGRTIDGSNKSRIFLISGKNITLKNIKFKNGYSHRSYYNPLNNDGGAIKINHNLNITFENCEFINNTSEENGGAISNRGFLNIVGSTFDKNTANGKYGYGGGIYNDNGRLTVVESTFNDNTENGEFGYGGGISNNQGLTIISKSTFNKNTSHKGGAIYNNYGDLNITDSILNKNVSQGFGGGGGATYNNHGDLNITNSILKENNTENSGGAIKNDRGTIVISKSTINNNTSRNESGAIYNYFGELRISKSTINKNISHKGDGGAIYNWKGELRILESEIKENTSARGGAISSEKSKYKINNSTIRDNQPDNIREFKSAY